MGSDLVLAAGKAASLLDGTLFDALRQVVEKKDDLVPKITGATSLVSALQKVAADLDSPDVAKAFTDIGLGDAFAKVQGWLSQIVGGSKEIPPQYLHLFDPLSEFKVSDKDADRQASWSVSTSGALPANATGYSLNVGAKGTLTLDAAGSWPDVTPPVQLLGLKVEGVVDTGGSAKLPIPYGSFSASGSASADLTLEYYFHHNLNDLFVVAVAASAVHLPDPFDLGAILDRMQTTDFEGVIYTFVGKASAQVQVSLADFVGLATGVALDLGASFGLSSDLSGTFTLALHKTTDGGKTAINATLSRNPIATTTLSASVGANLDYARLAQQVSAFLEAVKKQWLEVLGPIKPFLSPGTWLQNQAEKLVATKAGEMIKDQSLRAALINDLDAALGAQSTTDKGLADWLDSQVTSAINRGSVLVQDAANDPVKQMLDSLDKVVPALSSLAKTQLTNLLSQAVTAAEKGLNGAIAQILAKGEASYKQALKDAGADVSGAVGQLDGLTKSVRDLLDKVDDTFQKIIDGAEQALKQKVSARLTLSESFTSGEIVEVDCLIKDASQPAVDVFKALAFGRLQTIVELFDSNKYATDSVVIDRGKSRITRFTKHHSERGVEIAFLGFNISASDVANANVAVVVDGYGNVQVNLEGNVTKTVTTPNNVRQVSLVTTAALAQAAAMQAAAGQAAGAPQVSAVLELGIGASFSSQDLDVDEVTKFIASLEDAGLVSDKAKPGAAAAFAIWSKATGGKINGSVSGTLRLSGDAIGRLLPATEYDAGKGEGALSGARQTQIAQKALDELRAIKGAMDVGEFDAGYKLAKRTKDAATFSQAALIAGYPKTLLQNMLPDQPATTRPATNNVKAYQNKDQDNYVYFLDQVFATRRLIEFFTSMSRVYFGKLKGKGATDFQLEADRLVRSGGDWLQVATAVTDLFSPEIKPRTLAFMRAVADLGGFPNKPAVVVTLTYTPAGGGASQTIAVG